MWLKEWDAISCRTLDRCMRRIRSGAYHPGAALTSEHGSCAYQSPLHARCAVGLGISGCAAVGPLRHFSRNRWPTVAQVIGIPALSRRVRMVGTFALSIVARRSQSRSLAPRQAQHSSRSAEMDAPALAPFLKGQIRTPSKCLGVSKRYPSCPLSCQIHFNINRLLTVIFYVLCRRCWSPSYGTVTLAV